MSDRRPADRGRPACDMRATDVRRGCRAGRGRVGRVWDVCGEVLIEDGRRGYIKGEVISVGGYSIEGKQETV